MPDEVRDSFCRAEHQSTGVSVPRRTSFPDPVARQEGILHCVLGVFLISQDGVGQRDESRTRGEEHLLDCFPLVANRLSGYKFAGRVTGRAAGVWPNVIVPPSGTVEVMVCCSGAGTFTALRRYR